MTKIGACSFVDSRGHAPRYARSIQSPCRHKLVDVAGVEPACLIIFYPVSTSLVLLYYRRNAVILHYDCFGVHTHLVHHFKMVPLDDGYNYSENLTITIAVV